MHDHECWTRHSIVNKQFESILHATCLHAANYLKELGFVRMQDSNFWKGCIQSDTNCIHCCHTYTRLQNARLRAGKDYRVLSQILHQDEKHLIDGLHYVARA